MKKLLMYLILEIIREDFTYIDDIVEGIIKTLDSPATTNVEWDSGLPDPANSKARGEYII